MPLLTTGAGRYIVTAASVSGWGAKGTKITLSGTNNTIMTADSTGFAAARGTQGYSSGKHYFELKIIATGAILIGLCDATTATGAGLDNYVGGFNFGSSHFSSGGTGFTQGAAFTKTDLGASYTVNVNDVFGIAFDADNGFYYLARNNTYFLSGDPASGPTGTGHVCAITAAPTLYPGASGGNGDTPSIQLITSGFTYPSLPSGYSAWG